MSGSDDIDLDEETPVMREFLEEVVDATRLANGAYDDFTTADAVAVLQYRAEKYEQYGLSGMHPRNQPDDYEPLEGVFTVSEDGDVEATVRRSYDFDIGLKSGMFHGREISDDEMAAVVRAFAEHVEEHGVESIGEREVRE